MIASAHSNVSWLAHVEELLHHVARRLAGELDATWGLWERFFKQGNSSLVPTAQVTLDSHRKQLRHRQSRRKTRKALKQGGEML